MDLASMTVADWIAAVAGSPAGELRSAVESGDLVAIERAIHRCVGAVGLGAWTRFLQTIADDCDERGLHGDGREDRERWGRPTSECPRCGQQARRWRERSRDVLTSLGETRIERTEYRCTCDHVFAPADRAMGLKRAAGFSPRIEQLIEQYAPECDSYEEAKRHLGEWIHYVPSASVIGTTVITRGCEEAERLAERATAARRSPSLIKRIPDSATATDTMIIEIDGGMAPTRDGWREVKTAAIYLTRDRIEKPPSAREAAQNLPGRGRVRRSFVHATVADWDSFGAQLYPLAVSIGLHEAGRVVVLGDGARWIDQLQQAYFPGSDRILDFWHAMEHVCAPAKLLFGDNDIAFNRWRREQRSRLLDGNLTGAITAMHALARTTRSLPAGLSRRKLKASIAEHTRYLRGRRAQANYPAYRANALPIGSGFIEGRIKLLVKKRCSGGGARWTLPGLNAILALRCKSRNTTAYAIPKQAA